MNCSLWRRPEVFPTGRVLLTVLLLLLALGALPACGSNPTNQSACSAPTGGTSNAFRYWVRTVFAVSVQLNANTNAKETASNLSGSVLQSTITSQIANMAGQPSSNLKPYTSDCLPWYTVTPHTATLFFVLPNSISSNDPDGDRTLISVVDHLNKIIATNIEDGTLGNIQIQNIGLPVGASPDWLSGGAPLGDQVGGSPGGPPTSATKTLSSPSGTNSSQVPYYVLDTAPASQRKTPQSCGGLKCVPGVGGWGSGNVPKPFSGMVGSGLFQVSPLSVFSDGSPQPYEDIPIPGISTPSPLDIQDHGLFVSGLIHELAPNAPIRLLRVLNDYGVGDLKTLLFALQTIACDPAMLQVPGPDPQLCQQPASQIIKSQGIINLSLAFEPPLDCLGQIWNPKKWGNSGLLPSRINTKYPCGQNPSPSSYTPPVNSLLSTDDAAGSSLYVPALFPFEDLFAEGFDIVAAAGNDSRSVSPKHMDANMPAAFCPVIGAAATQGTPPQLALFSNEPYIGTSANPECLDLNFFIDSPPEKYGAGASLLIPFPVFRKYAPGTDVCSIYLDNLVNPKTGQATVPNSNGESYWSGTSFATAIVAGNVNPSGRTSYTVNGHQFTVPFTITQNTPGTC